MVVLHRVGGELLQPGEQWTRVEGQQTIHVRAKHRHIDELTQHTA